MSNKINYKTSNIDEATFLTIKGNKPTKIFAINSKSAVFTFAVVGRFNEHLNMFWGKGGLINIHTWLSVRQAYKNITSASNVANEQLLSDSKFGQGYFYIDNGVVHHSIFGKAKHHLERFKTGNFYYKKEEALNKLNNNV